MRCALLARHLLHRTLSDRRLGPKLLLHLGNGIGSKSTIRKQNVFLDEGSIYNHEFLDKVVDGLDRNSIPQGDVLFYIHVVKVCGYLRALVHGRRVHEHLTGMGIAENLHLGTHIIQMYLKCDSLVEAFEMFYSMPTKDLVLWTTMTTAFAHHGRWHDVLRLFDLMEMNNLKPAKTTYVAVLKAYSSPECLPGARLIHSHLTEIGADTHELVKAALVEMYANCGSFVEAREIFRTTQQYNVFALDAMLSACVQHGQHRLSFELFEQMEKQYVRLGKTAYAAILQACARVADLETGKRIHDAVIREGYDSDLLVSKALIDMYGRCRSIENARRIFDDVTHRDAGIWHLIISAYVDHGRCKEGFLLLREMQSKGFVRDSSSCVEFLRSCSSLLALEEARNAHRWIIEMGLELDRQVASTLVELYRKCGSLDEAQAVFDGMEVKTLPAWNSMLAGYAHSGFSSQVVDLFSLMQLDGSNWDGDTFSSLIQACGHTGLVKEGIQHFLAMRRDFSLLPTQEHYARVVSLLGRRSSLDDAEDFLYRLPELNPVVWEAFLEASRYRGDYQRAAEAATQILQLRPTEAAPYEVLANIYGAAGKQEMANQVLETLVARGMVGEPVVSSILIGGKAYHEFGTGDRTHRMTQRIHEILQSFSVSGSSEETKMHDVGDEVQQQGYHSEKLALGLGLLKTPTGSTLCIVKNCRVCGNCHSEFKLVSKLSSRVIVLRAGGVFHLFRDGACSCGDYF